MGTPPDSESNSDLRCGASPDAAKGMPVLGIPSTELLQGRREVLIQHEGETYRLRLTKNGKLILHK